MTDDGSVPRTRSTSRPWWLSIKGLLCLWGVAVVLATTMLFVADNFVLVEVRLMQLRIQARLAWVVIVSFLLGGLMGVAFGWLGAGKRMARPRRGAFD